MVGHTEAHSLGSTFTALLFMSFSTTFGSDTLVIGDNTLVMGTCMLGNAFGKIKSAEVTRTADKEEIENCGGNLRAVVLKKLRFEMSLETVFDTSVTAPGVGDAITLPLAGVTGTVLQAKVKWEEGKERGLSITATYWDALANAPVYRYNTSTAGFTLL